MSNHRIRQNQCLANHNGGDSLLNKKIVDYRLFHDEAVFYATGTDSSEQKMGGCLEA